MPPKRSKKREAESEFLELPPTRRTRKDNSKPSNKQKAVQKTKIISKEILRKKFISHQTGYNKNTQIPMQLYASILCNKNLDDEFFQCSLCYTTFISPQVTECGHTFCKKCITESLLYRITCPICKSNLKDALVSSNFVMNKFIAQKLCKDMEKKKDYEQVSVAYQKWFQEKQIPLDTLEQGLVVDFRDKDFYWLPAKVSKIEDNKHITFKYTKNGSSHQQVLPIYSERVAKQNSILSLREIRKVEQRINMNRNNFFNVQRPVNPPPMQRIANEPERHFNFVMREDNNPPRLGLGSLGFFQIQQPMRSIPSIPPADNFIFARNNNNNEGNLFGMNEESPISLPDLFNNNNPDLNFFE